MNHGLIKRGIFIAILILLISGIIAFLVSAQIMPKAEKFSFSKAQKIFAPANTLPEAPPAPKITILLFSGDVMLSRNVGQKMEKYNDWTWPFKDAASVLSSADLTIINLESPFTADKNHLVKTGSFSFNADPKAIAGLLVAGVDVASLANNHLMNQGAKGLNATEKLLTDNNIAYAGAGANSTEAGKPAIREVNGIKFGFLSYAYPNDSTVAKTSTPGIANMDIAKMKHEVEQLKTQADVAVILMHAGTEYTNKPNKQQIDFSHAGIDAGADLVIGHHPHWVQTTEIYRGKPILYSLGNLVFDQMWSLETRQGALAKITLQDKAIKNIEFIPVIIQNYGQAEIATSTALKQTILRRMGLATGIIEF